ncbi:hypothetical protein LJC07_03190 [Christensenellaceae bacterium OttesenSCG-928-L17]|nr:hypothetical protein [Christensenellaceae bacterium OttesenSCG-928-L17]
MALFDFFKKNKGKEKPVAAPKPAATQENVPPAKPQPRPQPYDYYAQTSNVQPKPHVPYSKEDIAEIVCGYIDQKGLDGLTNEEAELAKPFFYSLFYFYHDNAVKNDQSVECHRNGCNLQEKGPVFLTASRVLCRNCALQYILGNIQNWHYYFGNLAAGIGAVPASLQADGTELQKQISELRRENLFQALSSMTDAEIYQFVMDTDNHVDMRAEAVLKMKDVDFINKIALESNAYPVLINTLDFPLPKETVLHLTNQTNNAWGNKVRSKALRKLEELDG